MGEVYKARDTKLDRLVAIKVIASHAASDAGSVARFEREAKAIAALSHPNILAIYDFGTANDVLFAVTELLDGETLREALGGSAAHALSPRKATDYALQMARGLAAAHDKGIVHRDLKPENVFITLDGRVKILDFGLASVSAAAPEQSALATLQVATTPGTVLGTVAYMSPEQARGQATDHRTDIFALGAGVRNGRGPQSVSR
jgi:serine/threonine protein kinase